MTYKLEFLPSAFKEWHGLDHTIQVQFKKKLVERLETPEVPAARLTGWQHHYKIKLRTVGYRLVYEVIPTKKVLLVIAIGKCDGNKVYDKARENGLVK